METSLDIGFFAAFLGGLLSFASPCVLPLVPPYLAFMAGKSLDEIAGDGDVDPDITRKVVLSSFSFVLGLITVFIGMGATAHWLGTFVSENMTTLSWIAGMIIIILGLHFLGLFRIALLNREARFDASRFQGGLIGAYIIGMAFAFGWTPCTGPALAAVLYWAGQSATVMKGVALLFVYGLGLGLPFILAALFIRPFLGFMRRFRRHLGKVEKAMGLLLVMVGVMIIRGDFSLLSAWLYEAMPFLGRLG